MNAALQAVAAQGQRRVPRLRHHPLDLDAPLTHAACWRARLLLVLLVLAPVVLLFLAAP